MMLDPARPNKVPVGAACAAQSLHTGCFGRAQQGAPFVYFRGAYTHIENSNDYRTCILNIKMITVLLAMIIFKRKSAKPSLLVVPHSSSLSGLIRLLSAAQSSSRQVRSRLAPARPPHHLSSFHTEVYCRKPRNFGTGRENVVSHKNRSVPFQVVNTYCGRLGRAVGTVKCSRRPRRDKSRNVPVRRL